MRSNVENRQQPFANELVESLFVRWGFVSPRMALRREIHPPQEVLEAGVGAEAISALLVATRGDNSDSTLIGQSAVVS
jgi:hypothetical protein